MVAKYIYGALICSILCTTSAFAAPKTQAFNLSQTEKHKNPLLAIAKQQGSVGIIPYHVINGKIYVLLGQELTGGKRDSAGTFSDFGGNLNSNGTTVLQQALREFKKETLGQMSLSPEYVLSNSHLLYKNESGRDIYYIFIKFNEQQFNKTKKFNVAQVRLNAYSPPNSHFEKETFAWISLDDLFKQAVIPAQSTHESKETIALTKDTEKPQVKPTLPLPSSSDMHRFVVNTPQGESMNILIHNHLLQDCLQNPSLPALLKQLPR